LSETKPRSDEDITLLSIIEDICRTLDIKWVPKRISWIDSYQSGYTRSGPVISDVPSDHPVFREDTLMIAPSMRGRLEPGEWRPILASSLIYYAQFATRKSLGVLARICLVLAPVLLAFIALLLTVGPNSPGPYLLLGIIGPVAAIIGGFLWVSSYLRQTWLSADRKASNYVGPQVMLATLEKIQGFKIHEIEGGRSNDKPSLSQRIAFPRRFVPTS
jgi:hypothetical protein